MADGTQSDRVIYLARPNRPVLVSESLDELTGPEHGVVELPHRLMWNPNRRFSSASGGISTCRARSARPGKHAICGCASRHDCRRARSVPARRGSGRAERRAAVRLCPRRRHKVAALINRREVREYIDVAAALQHHTVAQLLDLARRQDPGLDPSDIVDVGRYLDRLDDKAIRLLWPHRRTDQGATPATRAMASTMSV